MSSSYSEKLRALLFRAGQGEKIVQRDVELAKKLLSSPQPENRAMACELLLRCNVKRFEKCVLKVIEELCARRTNSRTMVTVLVALAYCPIDYILSKSVVSEFVILSSMDEEWAVRTNAVSVLRQMAHAGSHIAIGRLKELVRDRCSYVRENAEHALGIGSTSPRVSLEGEKTDC